MNDLKIVGVSKNREGIQIQFPDGNVGDYKLEQMNVIPENVNADEWTKPCPSKCGYSVSGIIQFLGDTFAFCVNCDQWYNLLTGEPCDNPLNPEKENEDNEKSERTTS